MVKSYIAFLLVAIILLTASCEKMFFEPKEATNTAVFEHIWQYTNDYYCCFDFKDVNWDDVYDIYAPQVNDDMEEEEFLMLMHEMLSILEDDVVTLTVEMTTYSYEADTIYPENVDTNTVKLYKPTNDAYIIYGGIAYFNNFENEDFSRKLETIKDDISGVIIDIRSQSAAIGTTSTVYNSDDIGPPETNFTSVASTLSQESKKLGKKRFKNGPGKNDYEEIDYGIGAGAVYTGPVVVLCNRKASFELNLSAFLLSHVPTCTLIGDHTTGVNRWRRDTYLANGWILKIPTGTVLDMNEQSITDGIEPDIYVNDDPTTTNVDEIIEAALDLLN